MKISITLLLLLTFYLVCCFSISIESNNIKIKNYVEQTISNSQWYSLVPYQDSGCKKVGNGIGVSTYWDPENSTSTGLPYFYPYSNNNGICLNISGDGEKFNFIYKGYVCDDDGKYLSSETFELSVCKYSTFLKGYYKFTNYYSIPDGTIILPIYMMDDQPCDDWIPGFYNFIFNGTTFNTEIDGSTTIESFYCNINNELPYQKSCKSSSGKCSTKPLYNTCDKTDTFRFLCEGGPDYSSDNN